MKRDVPNPRDSNIDMTRRQVLRWSLAIYPYLTTNGFAQHIARDVSWLSEVRRRPIDLVTEPADLAPLGSDGQPIRDPAAWQRRRAELQRWWTEFLGIEARAAPAPDFRVLEEERIGTVLRQRIAYDSAPGWPTEAYLLRPDKLANRVPGVVVFHSTVDSSIRQPAGVEGQAEKAFGLELAQRGLLTLCPRNYLWPENRRLDATGQAERYLREKPRSKGMAKMLSDAMIAVDLLASLPQVDAQRIGALGHSLGAKEVLYLAAFDPRVRVTVSSEGGIGTTFSNWEDAWYLGPDIQRPEFTHDHHELLAMVAPRPFLLVGGDSADGDRSWPYIEAAMPVYELLGNSPRLGLFNHRQGHAVPPIAGQRMIEWIETYL
jgi:dienelactone hydrolase